MNTLDRIAGKLALWLQEQGIPLDEVEVQIVSALDTKWRMQRKVEQEIPGPYVDDSVKLASSQMMLNGVLVTFKGR